MREPTAEQKHAANLEDQNRIMAETELRHQEFACDDCPASFRFMDDYERHRIRAHGKTKEVARQEMKELNVASAKKEFRSRPKAAKRKKRVVRPKKSPGSTPPFFSAEFVDKMNQIAKQVDEAKA